MSASTAIAVLQNGTLRWSSPSNFNDPYDVPTELTYEFQPTEVMMAALQRCIELVESPPADVTRITPKLRQLIEAVKQGMPEPQKQALLARFREDVQNAAPTGTGLRDLVAMWRTFIPELRILCLCESATHVAMWHHYADQYRGVVVEFTCSDELDSAWLGAEQVTYNEAGNPLARLETWADLLVLETAHAVQDLTHLATFTKAADWGYEREWRLLSYKRNQDIGNYTDYRFDRRELKAVYLGPRITEDDAQTVKALTTMYPYAKLYRSQVGLGPRLKFHSDAL